MMNAGNLRLESLNRDYHDTWKIQMKAVLVKNETWKYVSGQCTKPTITDTADQAQRDSVTEWENQDEKAKADIILCISPSELKQIKNCNTSRDIWNRLCEIYQSTGPARKATLLKQLILYRMEENEDIRSHLRKFCDTVDKLHEMNVEIHPDLQAIMMLYSLPSSFENFRCAIESRDKLPDPENLRIKIIEEGEEN